MATGQRLSLRLLAAIVLTALIIVAAIFGSESGIITTVGQWLQDRGPKAAALLFLTHVVAGVFASPTWMFIALAGYLFGFTRGLALGYGAMLTASLAAFFVGRTIARSWVQQRLGDHRRLKALDAAVRSRGFGIVLMSRLSVVLPMNVLNYGYAITGVRAADFALGSVIGLVPMCVLFTLLGTSVDNLTTLANTDIRDRGGAWVLWLGLLIAAIVVLWVARLTTKALEAATREAEHNESVNPDEA